MIGASVRVQIFGLGLDESSTDVSECHRKVMSERKVVGAIRSLVNARGLQLEGLLITTSEVS